MRSTIALLLAAVSLLAWMERPVEDTHEGRPAIRLSNDMMDLLILPQGGVLASAVLKLDPDRLNPLWNPVRMNRDTGLADGGGGAFGLWACVDGFGRPSVEEQGAGFPFHGEAMHLKWETTYYGRQGSVSSLAFHVKLPLVQEELSRTYRMVDGEPVVYVESSLQSLLSFDRPAVWAEHFTVGAPFLEAGKTAADMPAGRSRTRDHKTDPPGVQHRLAAERDFTWPTAPLLTGGTVDLRTPPAAIANTVDRTAQLIDPRRVYGWVTALHPDKRKIIGCVFRREEFPWIQSWEFYAAPGRMARGLEFSTMPFDESRRASDERRLYGLPSHRWLPARGRLESKFLMFYTLVPEGFTRVDEIAVERGKLVIEDRTANKRVTVAASLPL
jgi:hypothetical protein